MSAPVIVTSTVVPCLPPDGKALVSCVPGSCAKALDARQAMAQAIVRRKLPCFMTIRSREAGCGEGYCWLPSGFVADTNVRPTGGRPGIIQVHRYPGGGAPGRGRGTGVVAGN